MNLLDQSRTSSISFSKGIDLPTSSGDLGVYCPLYEVLAGCGHTILTYRTNWTAKLCLECMKGERAKYKKSIWKKYYGERYREKRKPSELKYKEKYRKKKKEEHERIMHRLTMNREGV
jgi:hypothetical protein